MNRILKIIIHIGLVISLAITVLYYALLVWGAAAGVGIIGGVVLFLPGDLGMLMTVHDFLSLLLIVYWFHLGIHFRRMDRPLVPFAVFFFHIVVEPYLLLGFRGASFFHTGRFMTFYISYPIALFVLALWLLVWILQNRGALFARGGPGVEC